MSKCQCSKCRQTRRLRARLNGRAETIRRLTEENKRHREAILRLAFPLTGEVRVYEAAVKYVETCTRGEAVCWRAEAYEELVEAIDAVKTLTGPGPGE